PPEAPRRLDPGAPARARAAPRRSARRAAPASSATACPPPSARPAPPAAARRRTGEIRRSGAGRPRATARAAAAGPALRRTPRAPRAPARPPERLRARTRRAPSRRTTPGAERGSAPRSSAPLGERSSEIRKLSDREGLAPRVQIHADGPSDLLEHAALPQGAPGIAQGLATTGERRLHDLPKDGRLLAEGPRPRLEHHHRRVHVWLRIERPSAHEEGALHLELGLGEHRERAVVRRPRLRREAIGDLLLHEEHRASDATPRGHGSLEQRARELIGQVSGDHSA